MFTKDWRESTWNTLNRDWDLIIIGGGITGAGIFRKAVGGGLKVLLVEGNDFSSGTSSRSSKLVHGGIRYLRNRQYDITRESVKEREKILKEAKFLVAPLGFILPYSDLNKMNTTFGYGVFIYDLMAPKWKHSHLSKDKVLELVPKMKVPWLKGAYLYYDAIVDDSCMVQRLISESVLDGGTALNYAKVDNFLTLNNGNVCGVQITDQSSQKLGEQELIAKVVINATGPWGDKLRTQLGVSQLLRPQRGSHLVFPFQNLPLPHAVSLLHPKDGRAMFAIPWQGTTIVGTTDLDHPHDIDHGEPYCSQQEFDYILDAVNHYFPSAELSQEDVISSFAGLRPIVRGNNADPSAESRKHVVLEENGLITITGGKLTIFRIMAEDTLKKAAPRLGKSINPKRSYFHKITEDQLHFVVGVSRNTILNLAGRYGNHVRSILDSDIQEELVLIENLPILWAELRFAARYGAVEHLDDLLLRRVRLGLLLPDGALSQMEKIRKVVQTELCWDDSRWMVEEQRYRDKYDRYYSNYPLG